MNGNVIRDFKGFKELSNIEKEKIEEQNNGHLPMHITFCIVNNIYVEILLDNRERVKGRIVKYEYISSHNQYYLVVADVVSGEYIEEYVPGNKISSIKFTAEMK